MRSTSFGLPPTAPGNTGGGWSGSSAPRGSELIQIHTIPWLSATG